MKLEPLEAFIGDDPCVSYIGIRADENREGYISHKPNIKAAYPFIEDGIVKADVFQDPRRHGWYSRILSMAKSIRMLLLLFPKAGRVDRPGENHPDLFERGEVVRKD